MKKYESMSLVIWGRDIYITDPTGKQTVIEKVNKSSPLIPELATEGTVKILNKYCQMGWHVVGVMKDCTLFLERELEE